MVECKVDWVWRSGRLLWSLLMSPFKPRRRILLSSPRRTEGPSLFTICQEWGFHTHTMRRSWCGNVLLSDQSGQVPGAQLCRNLDQEEQITWICFHPSYTLKSCKCKPEKMFCKDLPEVYEIKCLPGLFGSWSALSCLPVRPSRNESTNWQWSSPKPVWSPML